MAAKYAKYIKPKWDHYKDVKGTCPACGLPAHVGKSMRNGEFHWLHDNYEDSYLCIWEPGTDPTYIEHHEAMRLIEGRKPSPRPYTARQVVCLETGEVFPSVRAGAASVGLKSGALSNAIRRERTAGGYHWEYAS